MSDEFLRTHPNFKANLPSLYMTPTTNKFRFPQDRNFDHYVAYASKSLEQLSFWQAKRIRFFQPFYINAFSNRFLYSKTIISPRLIRIIPIFL